jgi:putative toxin-antitoxin system antitoxin component (TIGR02293 family)
MDKNDRLHKIQLASLAFFEGNNEATQEWMKHPVKGLGNKRPIDMVGTDADTQIVLDLIGCLEHGVFS